MGKRILILCTGNSCRSQMAEGLLKSFDKGLQVFSAGTNPASAVNPHAITVMSELDLDISGNSPKNVELYIRDSYDFVITVCGNAKETCPVFMGDVKKHLHIGFEDPADATGTEKEILNEFRKIRDQIKNTFYDFYIKELKEEK